MIFIQTLLNPKFKLNFVLMMRTVHNSNREFVCSIEEVVAHASRDRLPVKLGTELIVLDQCYS